MSKGLLLLGLLAAQAAITNPNPIGSYSGKYTPTPNKWVALNKKMSFSNLSWGPNNYKFDDDRWGHKVVFIDPYNEYEEDNYERFKEMAKDKYILMCYFSAGTFEDFREVTKKWFEANSSRKQLFRQAMDDWPDEIWLDVSKYDLMKQYIRFQIDLLADFGCHGVEPDNIDCWANEDCVGSEAGQKKWYDHQKRLLKYMANYAHSKGLAIAHKNNTAMLGDLVDYFDCAIVESAHRYDEAAEYSPFISAGKPVFLTEYTYSGSGNLDKFCEASSDMQMMLKYQKSSKWLNCFDEGEFKNSYSYKYGEDGQVRSGGLSGLGGADFDPNDPPEEDDANSQSLQAFLQAHPGYIGSGGGGSKRRTGIKRKPKASTSTSETAQAAPEAPASTSETKTSRSNTAIIGAAAGAAGALLLVGAGVASYKFYGRKERKQGEADCEMHDQSHTSSYDFN